MQSLNNNSTLVKTITRLCKSLKDAERFQNNLYNRFDTVRLVKMPLFSEEGIYAWSVSK